MKIGMVGLGKMGGDMTKRLLQDGHEVVVYDLSEEHVQELVGEGAEGSSGLKDMIAKLEAPRVGLAHAALGRGDREQHPRGAGVARRG